MPAVGELVCGTDGLRQPAPLNRTTGRHVQDDMDDEHAQSLRAEGLDPDDPEVRAAIDLVRWELSLFPCLLRVRVARR